MLIHTIFISCALVLAYNSYKEIGSAIYSKYFLSHATRTEIKETFPWAVLLFTLMYLLCAVWNRTEKSCLTFRQYRTILILQAIITSLIFLPRGAHCIITLNLSIFYFVVMLLAWHIIEEITIVIPVAAISEALLPPILYRFVRIPKSIVSVSLSIPHISWKNLPIDRTRSATFIVIFMYLFALCALLVIFRLEKIAEYVADVAYFSLLTGVTIDAYRVIKNRIKSNEK